MIKNLAITVPSMGSIRIGDVMVNERGQRLPAKTNHFRITSLYKDADAEWVNHPMHAKVAEATNQKPDAITEIPVRLMFNNPELNMRARFEAYDRSGRIICAGDGACARRIDAGKLVQVPCPGSDYCVFGTQNRCSLFGRLNVLIEGQDDEFSCFTLRTESYNSVKTLYGKMQNMSAFFGNRLVGIPFKLKLRQKNSKKSMWSRFFFVDLLLNAPVSDAMKAATEYEDSMSAMGVDQEAYEKAVLKGLQNGPFEDGSEEFDELEPFLLARGLMEDEKEPAGEPGAPGATERQFDEPKSTAVPLALANPEQIEPEAPAAEGLEGLRNLLAESNLIPGAKSGEQKAEVVTA